MQRRAAYERDQLLARIQSDTEKAQELLAQRTALQEQRRAANMEASFQRQKLMQAGLFPPPRALPCITLKQKVYIRRGNFRYRPSQPCADVLAPASNILLS